jgi:2,5-diamino-6-(ribosylamino)-4(3H)-pyrimidinone 5'-phosphate reductase
MKTIIYLSVSVDGAITGFMPDMELHYGILGGLKPDAILVGSVTAKTGMEMFMKTVPEESPADRKKPSIADGDSRAYWFLVDTKGALQGLLHVYRQTGYCKDVIVLVSEKTPKAYLRYLDERGYDYHVVGEKKVDLPTAFALLAKRYAFTTLVTDAGSILPTVLLEAKLADEIHLLVVPTVVGKAGRTVFREMEGAAQGLSFLSAEPQKNGCVLLKYAVRKD